MSSLPPNITVSSLEEELEKGDDGKRYDVVVSWLPLAKNWKDVEVVGSCLDGVRRVKLFIPDSEHLPLRSIIKDMWAASKQRGELMIAETLINGQRTVFPYANMRDRRAFHEILKEEEERRKKC